MCNVKDYHEKREKKHCKRKSSDNDFCLPFCEILLPLSNISEAHFLSLAFYYVQHNSKKNKKAVVLFGMLSVMVLDIKHLLMLFYVCLNNSYNFQTLSNI